MTGTTDPDAIAFAQLGDEVDPVTESATQASSIQNALNNRILYTHRWLSASEKTAQQDMGEGDIGYQTDVDKAYIYCGLNLGWQPINYGSPRTISGALDIAPTGSGTTWAGSSYVPFPPGMFTSQPAVIASPYTHAPSQVHCSADQVTTAGFLMQLERTNSASTTCFYIASQAT